MYKAFVRSPSKSGQRPSALSRAEYRQCIELLAETRKKSHVSQTALARRLGKPQSWVAKCEDGSRRVDFVEFIQICEALGVDAPELLKRCRKRVRTRSE